MASAYRRSIVPWSPLRFMSTTIGRFATNVAGDAEAPGALLRYRDVADPAPGHQKHLGDDVGSVFGPVHPAQRLAQDV
jgi:hypothetical protein